MILTEQQILIQQTARAFAEAELAPKSAEWERTATFPREILRKMGGLGFMGMTVPTEWGGSGLDYVAYALALEEIAAGDGAVSTIMSGHNSVGCMPILEYGSEDQKRRYLRPLACGEMLSAFCLTEPGGGSDAAAIRTTAERRGDHYVLRGAKQFITTGSHADVAVVFAVTDANAGKRGITGFLVDTAQPGYRIGRVEKKMGQNASDTCEIFLEDATAPLANRLGEEGAGYKIALSNLQGGRIGIAAQAVGMARAALRLALAYAHQRHAFGVPIFQHQAVSFRLADMATKVETARQMVLHAADLRSAGRSCLVEASMAKLVASDLAEEVCSDAIQTFGGAGYIADNDVERIFRAVRVTRIYEGSNDIQRLVISRSLRP